MKEIIIMNIKKQLLLHAAWCCILLSIAACSDDRLAEVPSSNVSTGFCFRIEEPTTRISYNAEASQFENGDAIGCIIATRNGDSYDFLANSEWHYNNGILVLATENINNDGTVILERDTEKDEDSGFIKITGDGNYYFFFYYPCITDALITADYANATEAYNNDNSIPFYTLLSYPHWYTGTTSTTDRSQYTLCETPANSGQFNAWNSFPCFVNHYQASKKASNYSDFLWCIPSSNSTGGLNTGSDNTINLRFKKKTATIEVITDIALQDIYFQSPVERSLLRGKKINLQDGTLSDYTYNQYYGKQQQHMYMETTDLIRPYYTQSSDSKHDYRVMLPAQKDFQCNLYFQLPNETEYHTLILNEQLTELKEGGLYVIHINRQGESTLEIVDWDNVHWDSDLTTD